MSVNCHLPSLSNSITGIKLPPVPNKIMVQGQTEKLYCAALAPPMPTIQWTKNGVVVGEYYWARLGCP